MVASVKEEIKEELQEEELRQVLKEQQEKIDSMTDRLDLNGRVDQFLEVTKEQVDKETHSGE